MTECRYAALYRSLGIEELGSILSCGRDVAFVEGFNAAISLERGQTIMQGAEICRFCFKSLSTNLRLNQVSHMLIMVLILRLDYVPE